MSPTLLNFVGRRILARGRAGQSTSNHSPGGQGARPARSLLNLAKGQPGRFLLPRFLAVWLFVFAHLLPARAEEIQSRIVQVTVDGLYVDVGSEAGLKIGDRGVVLRGSSVIGSVQTATVTKSSALVQLQTRGPGEIPRTGDQVLFQVEPKEPAEINPMAEKPSSPTVKHEAQPDKPFVPLLAPERARSVQAPEPANLFHGRLWMRQLLQVDPESLLDYSLTRLGSGGSIDRLAGTPWAVEWNSEVSYRDGHALRYSKDYENVRLDMRQLSLFRRFDQGSFVRLGRFLPLELPAAGYLDGGQGDFVLNDHLRLGGMLGLKPDRVDLDPSDQEPTAVAYGTLEAGEPQRLYYSGTMGLLGAAYRGDADRLAVLLNQRATLSRWLNLYSSSELDVDVGGAEVRDGLEITRWNLYADSPILEFMNLRGGVDHYQIPDTRAEREALSIRSLEVLDRGYWRYYVGSSQEAPWNLSFDQELAFLDAPDYDFTPLWRLGISRRGIFSLKNGRVSLTVYNLESSTLEGYGGRVYGYFSILKTRLSLQPSLGFRWVEEDPTGEDLDLSDLALLMDWLISNRWSATAQVSHTFGTSVQATYLDLGLNYRW